MRDPNEATIESQSEHPGTRAAPVACIDLDRFCEGCAYNLRTLPVYRDERTGIPVVRCPECGRFQSANDASTVARSSSSVSVNSGSGESSVRNKPCSLV